MSPQPPKEKRGGISISPRTPLKRLKGAKLRFLPFGNPSKDKGSGSGKRGRECPLCPPMNAVPPNAGTQLFEEYLSAQPVGDFWILPAVRTGQPYVLGELTVLAVNSSRTLFLFHRARRIFFLAFQKENGGCIPAGKACIPAAVRRTYAHQTGAQFDSNKQMISISKQKEVFLWRN